MGSGEQASARLTRDEAYWTALLAQVTALPSEALEPALIWNRDGAAMVGRRPQDERAWEAAQALLVGDQIVELTVTGFNQGGLLVGWQGLQGFVPASQLRDFPLFHLPVERDRELERRVGQRLTLKLIEVNPAKNRLVFSERAAQVAATSREQLWAQLAAGQVHSGVITNMTRFGAFVDLGGVEGLIHLSELSWRRINHPEDVVQPGQWVQTLVLQVDKEHERIALSLKRMRPYPWQGVSQRYQVGEMVSGVVSNVVSFGAFVTLEEELEGLIHTSQLAPGAAQRLNRGQTLLVRVLDVDEAGRRLALALTNI